MEREDNDADVGQLVANGPSVDDGTPVDAGKISVDRWTRCWVSVVGWDSVTVE